MREGTRSKIRQVGAFAPRGGSKREMGRRGSAGVLLFMWQTYKSTQVGVESEWGGRGKGQGKRWRWVVTKGELGSRGEGERDAAGDVAEGQELSGGSGKR